MRIILVALISTSLFALERANIAFIIDGPFARADALIKRAEKETLDLLSGEFDVKIVEFEDGWTLSGAHEVVARAMNDPAIDVVVTMGFLSSYAALARQVFEKPLVVPYDINFFLESTETISLKVSYISSERHLADELERFKEIGKVKEIAVVGDASLIATPYFETTKLLIEKEAKKLGLSLIFVPVKDDGEEALETIDRSGADGVFFLPTYRLSEEKLKWVVMNLEVPSFSIMGEDDVARGVLMTITPDTQLKRLARRIALNTQSLLLDGDAKDTIIILPQSKELVINEETSHRLDLDLTFDVLAKARFINELNTKENQALTIWETGQLAIAQNLDLLAENFFVRAGQQDVIRSRANLLPQINTAADATQLDPRSAILGAGTTPQKSITGKVKLDQMIYDDDRVADFSIQSKEQRSRVYNRDSLELDIMLEASRQYLTILRTRGDIAIATQNLSLTQANLRRAHERVESGEARRSEIYRWESEEAENRDELSRLQDLVEDQARELNRLLNRPLEPTIFIEDLTYDSPGFPFDYGMIDTYANTPKRFALLSEYLVSIGEKHSPELKSIHERILAQERRKTAAERSFYLPKFDAFAEGSGFLAKGGEGSTPPLGLSNSRLFTSVGISANYPLFTSGSRQAERNQARYEISRLRTDYAATQERVAQRILSAVDAVRVTYNSIFYAKEAADAGDKNLKIVSENYTRGAVSIVDLIDAQNQAITSRRVHSNAIYDYLIAIMRLQRSLGKFERFTTEAEKDEAIRSAVEYIEKHEAH